MKRKILNIDGGAITLAGPPPTTTTAAAAFAPPSPRHPTTHAHAYSNAGWRRDVLAPWTLPLALMPCSVMAGATTAGYNSEVTHSYPPAVLPPCYKLPQPCSPDAPGNPSFARLPSASGEQGCGGYYAARVGM